MFHRAWVKPDTWRPSTSSAGPHCSSAHLFICIFFSEKISASTKEKAIPARHFPLPFQFLQIPNLFNFLKLTNLFTNLEEKGVLFRFFQNHRFVPVTFPDSATAYIVEREREREPFSWCIISFVCFLKDQIFFSSQNQHNLRAQIRVQSESVLFFSKIIVT